MATADQLDQQLQRWLQAGLLDSQSAGRIREFETSRESSRMRWPVVFAIAFGSIMVAAGILLFVAAHWENLSPTQRFLLVLVMISGFHLAAGALMPRFQPFGLALHVVGTVALGGGIFLAGQIFNLQEHWPGGILLWAIGAVLSWLVLQDWLQATLAALLIPAWIASEWSVRAEHFSGMERILVQFLTLLAITYLSARRGKQDSHFRQALMWAGGLALLPLGAMLGAGEWVWYGTGHALPLSLHGLAVLAAFGLPLLAAWLLRGKAILWNFGFGSWVFLVGLLDRHNQSQNVAIYGLCALAAIGLVIWGLQEQRRERINLGVAGFALTIMVFYFSSVMGKLGRSASLVGFGLLFLLGGWQLERLRRKLVAHMTAGGAS
ncbi:MAG TPA: DUF2157 domain-containing protein [Candidatus Polarisedimenticolia bacterium]|nr:DUF2157 domain-containing protein [Candidatus Polarisedimenticolia bacterium]